MSTVQEALDLANPNFIAAMFRKVLIGDLLAGLIPAVNSRKGLASNAVQVNDVPGAILAVESPAGTDIPIVGPAATPGVGEVAIAYDTEGIATLTFQAAVTAYDALQTTLPAALGTTMAEDSGVPV